MLALLLGCSVPPAPTVAPPPADAWLGEVEARLSDAAHAFVVDGDGWVARVPERGLDARFDAGGVTLGGIHLAATGTPALGACVDGMAEPDGRCVRRLEYDDGDVVGWWVARGDGLEQGWAVAAPTADGPLRLEVGVEGADVLVADDEVRLLGDEGRWLEVGGLVAIDADGKPLPARFARAPGGFAVEVDDTDARYPVEIDPVYDTADWSVYGEVRNAPYASTVAGAGDVDGDGYDDVIVGTDGYAIYTGAAYVFPGSASGVSSTASATLTGTTTYHNFGHSVAGAGDVNGDGYDDVIVGEDYATGAAYLYLGSAAGLSTSAAWSATGETSTGYYGSAVRGIGDVNGDGYDDVAVSSTSFNSGAGRIYVYAGSATGLSTSAVTTLDGAASEGLGGALAGGDVNGDGYADLAVGSSGYSSSTGRVWVFLGSASGLSTAAATTLTGAARYAGLGAGVALADVDGDNFDDLVIGASYEYKVYVYAGSAAGVAATATTLANPDSSNAFGSRVANAGDLDADGYEDVLVGAYLYGSYDPGRVYVYRGRATGLPATPDTTLTGAANYAELGYAVAGAGDVDGDGYADVVIGAPGNSSTTGHAYVYHGSAAGLSTTASTTMTGSSGAFIGSGLAGGDVNGDGYADAVIGAPYSTDTTGNVYVYLGSEAGLPDTADVTIPGVTAGTWFGNAVDAADLDGDGFDDVIVGAYYGSSPKVYVFDGGAAGPSTTASATLSAPSVAAQNFGQALAGAGDVNGDGFGDLVVGASGADTAATDAGAAYVYLGSATGVATSPATTLLGTGSYDYFGLSVDGAGDVNADGYDDIVVGAPYQGSNAGRVHLFLGSASGVPSVASTILSGDGTQERFGYAVAGAGDVQGDGYADVIVGAPYNLSNDGNVYVFSGSATGLATTATTLTPPAVDTMFGQAVAAAGDVDGDGYDDVVVGNGLGATGTTVPPVGLYLGGAAGVATTAATTLTGTATSTFGYDVTGVGDVDGDGYDDLLVGAYYYRAGGAAYLYRGYADVDGDGIAAVDDCDDADATVGEASTVYADADGDGYGDAATSATACAASAGQVSDATDCDDTRADVSPAGVEVCDGATDEDCDGLVDDADPDVTGTRDWYTDTDGDTFGAGTPVAACVAPAGTVADATDCDDTDVTVLPGAPEIAGDGIDEDCDGAETCYVDADGDGARTGDTTAAGLDCAGAAFATAALDCDDTDATVLPGAAEIVGDGVDQDCDGAEVCYVDADGDGARTADTTTGGLDCGGAALATASLDCDDADASTHPGAPEPDCTDPVDHDCDGTVVYADADADGWAACVDCDDGDPDVRPDATEAPGDGLDADCDGVDTCYVDADDDGHRSLDAATIAGTTVACDAAGEATAADPADDCDDADAATFPGAAEVVGDGVDEDCDGGEVCYVDGDADGWIVDTTSSVASADVDCDDAGEATSGAPDGDCDDADAARNPGVAEPDCTDPVDYNCDGSTGYADADGDGFAACEECDDGDADAWPGAPEAPGDAIDQDCDGVDLCYVDADGDGWRTDATVTGAGPVCDGAGEAEATVPAGDCDDAAADTWPGAPEVVGDEVDGDCDGGEVCYADGDGDGWRTDATVASGDVACDGAGEATGNAPAGDCDDADRDTYPGAPDTPDDGIDQDCSGADTTTPEDTGTPDDTGSPDDTGTPEDTGTPDDTGSPDDTATDTGAVTDTGDPAPPPSSAGGDEAARHGLFGCASGGGEPAAILVALAFGLAGARRR